MPYTTELVTNTPFILVIICACIVLCLLLIACVILCSLKRKSKRQNTKLKKNECILQRHEHNPVISPTWREWETVGTFNPAAIKDNEGFVHLLYRAIGEDGLSRIGYAKSCDGLKFNDRTDYPVYISASTRNTKSEKDANKPHAFNPNIYILRVVAGAGAKILVPQLQMTMST